MKLEMAAWLSIFVVSEGKTVMYAILCVRPHTVPKVVFDYSIFQISCHTSMEPLFQKFALMLRSKQDVFRCMFCEPHNGLFFPTYTCR